MQGNKMDNLKPYIKPQSKMSRGLFYTDGNKD